MYFLSVDARHTQVGDGVGRLSRTIHKKKEAKGVCEGKQGRPGATPSLVPAFNGSTVPMDHGAPLQYGSLVRY